MVLRKIVLVEIALLLTALCLFCASELLKISDSYNQQARIAEASEQYRPGSADNDNLDETIFNQGIYDLQHTVNSEVMGWLTLDGTVIDYPFVQGADNQFYLTHDLNRAELYTGTIFADHRCARDLSDFNTILYGHSTINHSMFGDLGSYLDQEYFAAHQAGTLSLVDGTYQLQIFACLTVSATDPVLYNPVAQTAAEQALFLDSAAQRAQCYREVPAPSSHGVLTLSSCSPHSTNSRIVLLAMIR